MNQIDEKYLKGLTFRTAKKQAGEKGKPKIIVPVETPLKPEQVLDFSEDAARVVIVAADGRKHIVDKNAKPAAENAPDPDDGNGKKPGKGKR